MIMKKIEMNFSDLMMLSKKLVSGEQEVLEITNELIDAIKDRMFAVTRRRNKANVIYDQAGLPELHWTINKGWTCMDAKAQLLGDILRITRTNGDTGEQTTWFYKIEGYEPTKKEEDATEKTFKVENTAIDTNQSFTAKLVVENIKDGNKVLDYGCGTGRNMRYIKNNSDAESVVIEGCDIADQLVRNAHKHQELKNNGMDVFEDVNTPKEKYDVVLNSHVLNVIASDEIKQAVVKNIYDALVDGGKAMIEVRTKSDVEGAKHKIPFGDGWHMTKTNTYQESLTKEKMQRLAISAGFDIIEHVSNSSRHYMIVEKNIRKVAVA